MRPYMQRVVVFGLFVLAVGLMALSVVLAERHQPASAREQKPKSPIWQIGVFYGQSVGVIETTGACIYVSDGFNSGGIAVLSKKDLPPGAGCQ